MDAEIPEGDHRFQSTYCLWYSRKASGKSQNSFDQVGHLEFFLGGGGGGGGFKISKYRLPQKFEEIM